MNPRNLIIAACLAISASAAAAADRDFHWYFFPIDTMGIPQDADGMTTGAAKLAYDAKGTPKVAYGRGEDVYYAELDGNNWKWQKADTAFKYEAKLALELDADGNPHIIHEDWRYRHIHYANWDGKEWRRKILDTILDETFGNFYSLGLKLDADKDIHMFHPRMNTAADGHSGITYARYTSALARVRRDALCQCGSSGKWADIVLNSKGAPIVAYFKNAIEKIQVAHLKDGAWVNDTVVGAEFPGAMAQYASIARDANDSLYISHHHRDSAALLLSSGKVGGPYKTEKIAPVGGSPLWIATSTIALSKTGTPYVAYVHGKQDGQYRFSESKLRLAWKKDGAWNTETVDSSGAITGVFADMVLNKDDLPSIVYFNYSKKQLWLAEARLKAPKDEDNNGLLDYKEIPIGTVGLKKNLLQKPGRAGKKGAGVFDAGGRSLKTAAAKRKAPATPAFAR